MGNRIAKVEGQERWFVYQSVTETCYVPIFFEELSAWLYAHLVTVNRRLFQTASEGLIGSEVTRFIRLSYCPNGDFEETPMYLDELADVTAWNGPGQDILAALVDNFIAWRKSPDTLPPERTVTAETE